MATADFEDQDAVDYSDGDEDMDMTERKQAPPSSSSHPRQNQPRGAGGGGKGGIQKSGRGHSSQGDSRYTKTGQFDSLPAPDGDDVQKCYALLRLPPQIMSRISALLFSIARKKSDPLSVHRTIRPRSQFTLFKLQTVLTPSPHNTKTPGSMSTLPKLALAAAPFSQKKQQKQTKTKKQRSKAMY